MELMFVRMLDFLLEFYISFKMILRRWFSQKNAMHSNLFEKWDLYFQLELCNASRYLLRTSNDNETQEWFEALRDVIARLVSINIF